MILVHWVTLNNCNYYELSKTRPKQKLRPKNFQIDLISIILFFFFKEKRIPVVKTATFRRVIKTTLYNGEPLTCSTRNQQLWNWIFLAGIQVTQRPIHYDFFMTWKMKRTWTYLIIIIIIIIIIGFFLSFYLFVLYNLLANARCGMMNQRQWFFFF